MSETQTQIEPIRRAKPYQDTSQVARATLGLREMLLRGVFRPGERIAEIPLSAKLGVSRTPLRLAFEKLEHEGLVKALPNAGFAASQFSIEDVWNAIEIRGVLEGAAARLAAERWQNPAELDHLRGIQRSIDGLSKLDLQEFGQQYLDLNESFHAAIVELSRNEALRRALDQVSRLPFSSPGAAVLLTGNRETEKEVRSITHEHHRALIEAIERREGSRAESLAREHARVPRRNLELALANRNFLDAVPGACLIKFPIADSK